MPVVNEEVINLKVLSIYKNYALSIGRDVSNVTQNTKLKFPSGLQLSSAELSAMKVPLNELIEPYSHGAEYFVEPEVSEFETIKEVQAAVWNRIKSLV